MNVVGIEDVWEITGVGGTIHKLRPEEVTYDFSTNWDWVIIGGGNFGTIWLWEMIELSL